MRTVPYLGNFEQRDKIIMKLSIAVCTHNEGNALANLLNSLATTLVRPREMDIEVVIIDDFSSDEETIWALDEFKTKFPDLVVLWRRELDGDFAAHKNFMNSKCTGDWILNLDADETISASLIENIDLIVDANPDVEAYWFPRVNTVSDITLDDVRKWGWILTTLTGFTAVEQFLPESPALQLLQEYNYIIEELADGFVRYHVPIINWPDPQMRLYKNAPHIAWTGTVHERLEGFSNYTAMPLDPEYAIIHNKTIRRQREQNLFYESLIEKRE